jgi:hypothetical protein
MTSAPVLGLAHLANGRWLAAAQNRAAAGKAAGGDSRSRLRKEIDVNRFVARTIFSDRNRRHTFAPAG